MRVRGYCFGAEHLYRVHSVGAECTLSVPSVDKTQDLCADSMHSVSLPVDKQMYFLPEAAACNGGTEKWLRPHPTALCQGRSTHLGIEKLWTAVIPQACVPDAEIAAVHVPGFYPCASSFRDQHSQLCLRPDRLLAQRQEPQAKPQATHAVAVKVGMVDCPLAVEAVAVGNLPLVVEAGAAASLPLAVGDWCCSPSVTGDWCFPFLSSGYAGFPFLDAGDVGLPLLGYGCLASPLLGAGRLPLLGRWRRWLTSLGLWMLGLPLAGRWTLGLPPFWVLELLPQVLDTTGLQIHPPPCLCPSLPPGSFPPQAHNDNNRRTTPYLPALQWSTPN
ncbi:UNVERIFIED_CONTAM: hypothetical protein FKN15_066848 [Acipenser sinensis]